MDANYGYFHTKIEQDLLFGTQPDSNDPTTDYTTRDNNADYKQTVQTLMTNNQLHETYGKQSRDYIKNHHDKEIIVPQFEAVLHELHKSR